LDEKTKAELAAQKKINELKHKQDVAQKLQSIFNILLGTAEGIAANLKNPTLIPFIAALGAIQLATAIATPLPKYRKGTTFLTGAHDEIPVMAHRGESILPVEHTRDYNKTINAIYKRAIPAHDMESFVSWRLKQPQSFSQNISNSMTLDYDLLAEKLGREMAWQLRGAGDVRIKNYKQLAEAISSNYDPRKQ